MGAGWLHAAGWGFLAGSALLTGAAAGFWLEIPQRLIAAATATAAGAIPAMLADTMIPEAFEYAHGFTGLITVAGFLTAFIISKIA